MSPGAAVGAVTEGASTGRVSPRPAIVALGGLWVVAMISVWVADDEPAIGLGLLLAIPVTFCALHIVAQFLMAPSPLASLLAIGVVLAVSVNFRHRGFDDKSIDSQILLRSTGIALFFVLSAPMAIRRLLSGIELEPLLWIALLACLVASSSYAAAPVQSLVAALSALGGFLFLWAFCEVYGRQSLIRVITAACLVLSIGSIVIYFTAPSLGRLSDFNAAGQYEFTSRLQGFFGNPNGAGASAAPSLLLALLLQRRRGIGIGHIAMLGIFAIVTVMSNNRMALIASAGCLATVYICQGNFVVRAIVVLLAGAMTTFAAYALGEVLLASIARSGSSEEILSLTGRTEIWRVALELWAEHPILGLGYSSSPFALKESPDLLHAAGNTHNTYLEILFSSGPLGFGLLVTALAITLKRAAARRRYSELAIVIFFAIYGLTEAVIFSVAGLPMLLFFSSLILTFTPDRPAILPNMEPRPRRGRSSDLWRRT
jgi:O-antigen ligase